MSRLEEFENWLVAEGENHLRYLHAVNRSASISNEQANTIQHEKEAREINAALVLLGKFRKQA